MIDSLVIDKVGSRAREQVEAPVPVRGEMRLPHGCRRKKGLDLKQRSQYDIPKKNKPLAKGFE